MNFIAKDPEYFRSASYDGQ
jgi:hypothetical protein